MSNSTINLDTESAKAVLIYDPAGGVDPEGLAFCRTLVATRSPEGAAKAFDTDVQKVLEGVRKFSMEVAANSWVDSVTAKSFRNLQDEVSGILGRGAPELNALSSEKDRQDFLSHLRGLPMKGVSKKDKELVLKIASGATTLGEAVSQGLDFASVTNPDGGVPLASVLVSYEMSHAGRKNSSETRSDDLDRPQGVPGGNLPVKNLIEKVQGDRDSVEKYLASTKRTTSKSALKSDFVSGNPVDENLKILSMGPRNPYLVAEGLPKAPPVWEARKEYSRVSEFLVRGVLRPMAKDLNVGLFEAVEALDEGVFTEYRGKYIEKYAKTISVPTWGDVMSAFGSLWMLKVRARIGENINSDDGYLGRARVERFVATFALHVEIENNCNPRFRRKAGLSDKVVEKVRGAVSDSMMFKFIQALRKEMGLGEARISRGVRAETLEAVCVALQKVDPQFRGRVQDCYLGFRLEVASMELGRTPEVKAMIKKYMK